MKSVEQNVIEWQLEKFPYATTENITAHLMEELKELLDELGEGTRDYDKVLKEGAQVVMLLIGTFHSLGTSVSAEVQAMLDSLKDKKFTYIPELGYSRVIKCESCYDGMMKYAIKNGCYGITDWSTQQWKCRICGRDW